MSAQKAGPSRAWYVVAWVVAAVGCVLAGGFVGAAIGSRIGQIETFAVHRPERVLLAKGATRSIYAESRPGLFPVPVTCRVDPLGGRPTPRVDPVERGSSEVRVNDTLWVAVAKVTAYEDGRYVIACTAPPGQPVRLALGPAAAPDALVRDVGIALGSGLLGLTGGVVIATVTALRRRAARRPETGAAPPPPPGPATGTPPGPPGR